MLAFALQYLRIVFTPFREVFLPAACNTAGLKERKVAAERFNSSTSHSDATR